MNASEAAAASPVFVYRARRFFVGLAIPVGAAVLLALPVIAVNAEDQSPEEGKLQPANVISCATFSPDGKKLALANGNGSVAILEMPSRRFMASFPAPQWLEHIVFSPDGSLLVGQCLYRNKQELLVWETSPEWKRLRPFSFDEASYPPFAFSPDGKMLAVFSGQGSVRLYDFATRKLIKRLSGMLCPNCMAFSPDGKTLAAGGQGRGNSELSWWDTATGRVQGFVRDKDRAEVTSVAFLEGGSELAWAGRVRYRLDSTIQITDLRTGAVRAQLVGHNNVVSALVPLPDGRLISGSYDRTVRLWDVNGGKEIGRVPAHSRVVGLSLSPDRSVMACADSKLSGEYQIWDMDKLFDGRAAPLKKAAACPGSGAPSRIRGFSRWKSCPAAGDYPGERVKLNANKGRDVNNLGGKRGGGKRG